MYTIYVLFKSIRIAGSDFFNRKTEEACTGNGIRMKSFSNLCGYFLTAISPLLL